VRALLDTHAFLWAVLGDPRLSMQAHDLIEDRGNVMAFSAASAYELALKARIGRLTLPAPPDVYVPTRLAAFGFDPLPIEITHSTRAASLPPIHPDPWDRLLIAQAQIEDLPIITVDPLIGRYDVETVW
jgi:PIN domain nuclease of toxin-antitoxin system